MPPVALAKSGGKKGKLRGITQVAGPRPETWGYGLPACGAKPHMFKKSATRSSEKRFDEGSSLASNAFLSKENAR